jgi:hypothetical protein
MVDEMSLFWLHQCLFVKVTDFTLPDALPITKDAESPFRESHGFRCYALGNKALRSCAERARKPVSSAELSVQLGYT